MSETVKDYLGDSVYVEKLDYGIRLFTNNGEGAPNPPQEIFIEPAVYAALLRFVERTGAMR